MSITMTPCLSPRSECELDLATQEFYDGVVDLFLEQRAGHMGRYVFSSAKNANDCVCGDKHWTDFIHTSTAYYPYRHQIEIISCCAKQLGAITHDAPTYVDLGTGSLNSFEHKVLPILRAGQFKELIFVDLCHTFSKAATDRLEQEAFSLETSTFLGNFFTTLPLLTQKAVINLFGITLGNIIVNLPYETPERVLARTMEHFASPLREHGGYFVFDYDTNEDECLMHASYDHPSYHAMELTIAERIKRDLPTTDFNANDFEHITVWYPQWKLLAQELRTKSDLSFMIGPYRINALRGQSYRTGSSFKYSDEVIEQSAKSAGFNKVALFSLPDSTMRVAVYGIEASSSS